MHQIAEPAPVSSRSLKPPWWTARPLRTGSSHDRSGYRCVGGVAAGDEAARQRQAGDDPSTAGSRRRGGRIGASWRIGRLEEAGGDRDHGVHVGTPEALGLFEHRMAALGRRVIDPDSHSGERKVAGLQGAISDLRGAAGDDARFGNTEMIPAVSPPGRVFRVAPKGRMVALDNEAKPPPEGSGTPLGSRRSSPWGRCWPAQRSSRWGGQARASRDSGAPRPDFPYSGGY